MKIIIISRFKSITLKLLTKIKLRTILEGRKELLYDVIFYKKKNGEEPVYDYIQCLSKRKNKDSRIKLNKINDYIEILAQYGTYAGEPYMKHLQDGIWELRPLRERILFAADTGDEYVLLHPFLKKTKKTPHREIEKAKKEFSDYCNRKE